MDERKSVAELELMKELISENEKLLLLMRQLCSELEERTHGRHSEEIVESHNSAN